MLLLTDLITVTYIRDTQGVDPCATRTPSERAATRALHLPNNAHNIAQQTRGQNTLRMHTLVHTPSIAASSHAKYTMPVFESNTEHLYAHRLCTSTIYRAQSPASRVEVLPCLSSTMHATLRATTDASCHSKAIEAALIQTQTTYASSPEDCHQTIVKHSSHRQAFGGQNVTQRQPVTQMNCEVHTWECAAAD